MEAHWTEMSPGIPPAEEEEESADKVTVVLAAVEGSGGNLQAALVGAGCVLVAAVDETVIAVAVRVAAGAPVLILGSWTGLAVQG